MNNEIRNAVKESVQEVLAQIAARGLKVSIANRETVRALPTMAPGTYAIPGSGTVVLQILGDGNIHSIQFTPGGASYALNVGTSLVSQAFYEFEFLVIKGMTLIVSQPETTTVFWRPE